MIRSSRSPLSLSRPDLRCFVLKDTNGLALHTLAPVLGVSESMELAVNSMAVPRKAKQAVGGIAKLKHNDGRQMTVSLCTVFCYPLTRYDARCLGPRC